MIATPQTGGVALNPSRSPHILTVMLMISMLAVLHCASHVPHTNCPLPPATFIVAGSGWDWNLPLGLWWKWMC